MVVLRKRRWDVDLPLARGPASEFFQDSLLSRSRVWRRRGLRSRLGCHTPHGQCQLCPASVPSTASSSTSIGVTTNQRTFTLSMGRRRRLSSSKTGGSTPGRSRPEHFDWSGNGGGSMSMTWRGRGTRRPATRTPVPSNRCHDEARPGPSSCQRRSPAAVPSARDVRRRPYPRRRPRRRSLGSGI